MTLLALIAAHRKKRKGKKKVKLKWQKPDHDPEEELLYGGEREVE